MKIVFMGTPDFAAASLAELLACGHEILAVYTQPDRPSGRGNKLKPSAVKLLAEQHRIPVYQPQKVRAAQSVTELAALQPEIIIVVAYGQLLPQAILDIPKYGCLNVHGSILPQYRGASPIHQAIMDGQTRTGVTIMQMDAGMDTGDILTVAYEDINPEDTTEGLYERLKTVGAKLLADTLPKLAAGELIPVKQDDTKASYAGMITADMERIDWLQPAISIHNKIRALGSSYAVDAEGNKLKFWQTRVEPEQTGCPGEVVSVNKKFFTVATGFGALTVLEVQPANRKRMSAGDFVNGRQMKIGYRFV